MRITNRSAGLIAIACTGIALAAGTVVAAEVRSGAGAGQRRQALASRAAPAAIVMGRKPTRPGPPAAPRARHASSTPLGLPPRSMRANPRDRPLVDSKAVRAPNTKDKVQNGESNNPYSTKQMIYHGGAVQTTPRIYLVLWGSSWSTTDGDPYGVANRLHYFYSGVSGSGWANVLKQYGSNANPSGSFTNAAGQYKGWIKDSTPVPVHPTRQDVANAATRAANYVRDYSYNAQYVVAMPWGVSDQYSTTNHYCAWHNALAIAGSWVTYTALPYAPYMDTNVYGCGGGKVNGATGGLDGVTILAGHEYAESVNDPGLNGWSDTDSSENGDKCAWTNLANRTLANGYSFPMQPTWSNTWRAQYGYGCYYS